jgi:hypothetical protein
VHRTLFTEMEMKVSWTEHVRGGFSSDLDTAQCGRVQILDDAGCVKSAK